MTSPIEKQAQRRPTVDVGGDQRFPCGLIPQSSGWVCSQDAGHPAPCTATQVAPSEPPAADPTTGPGPAASAVSTPPPRAERRYGFNRRPEFDVDLPSGAFVRVRQLTMDQIIDLDVLNMQDSFAAELFKGVDEDNQPALNVEEAERAIRNKESRENFFGPLNRVVAAAVICPRVVLEGDSSDEQIHVGEISIVDKRVIFEYAMPDEMKPAALEAQQDALKSVRPQ